MKKVSVLVFSLFFSALVAQAGSEKSVWDCAGDNIEAGGVSVSGGKFSGSLSWDCFPGGGICDAMADLTQEKGDDGDTYFKGKGFWLVVHTSEAPINGAYKAHLIATDLADTKDEGRGLKFDEFVSCSEK